MTAPRANALIGTALAGAGAAAILLSPIPAAYGILVIMAGLVEIVRGEREKELLPRGLLTVIGLAGFFFTLLPFSRETLAEQSLAALSILLAVKLLEKKKRRDHLQILTLAAIVTVGAGSLAPEMAFGVLLLLVCILGTFDLLWLPFAEAWPSDEASPGLFRRLLRICLAMLVLSLPLAVALFVVLPRSMNPFWGGLTPAQRRVSGFSDDLSLGDVGRLALSGDVAFRAEMTDPATPLANTPYWRGVVMEETDGRRWTSRSGGVAVKAVGRDDRRVTYYVEPHGERQLFLLEQPWAAYIGLRARPLDPAGVLRLRTPLFKRIRYLGFSRPGRRREGRLSPDDRGRNLQLPRDLSPEIRALAAERAGGAKDDAAVAERFLAFFRGNFTYTLDVPPESGDPLEEFLLRRRSGYCEYFASALAVMLRSVEIPARVVAGYLGGEFNANGGYYLVRQSAAHTWVEAWLDDGGWTRLDPTPAAGELGGTFASRNQPPSRLWLDALRMKWNSWIVQYDAEVQIGLVQKGARSLFRFRLPSPSLPQGKRLLLLLPLLLLPALWRLLPAAADPLTHRFRRFQSFARRRAGVEREPWEGPLDFGGRVACALGEGQGEVLEFVSRWAALRYGCTGRPGRESLAEIDEFLRQILNKHEILNSKS